MLPEEQAPEPDVSPEQSAAPVPEPTSTVVDTHEQDQEPKETIPQMLLRVVGAMMDRGDRPTREAIIEEMAKHRVSEDEIGEPTLDRIVEAVGWLTETCNYRPLLFVNGKRLDVEWAEPGDREEIAGQLTDEKQIRWAATQPTPLLNEWWELSCQIEFTDAPITTDEARREAWKQLCKKHGR